MICMGGSSRVIVTRHYMGDRYQQGQGGAVSKCPPTSPTYREDTASCVSGLTDCSLSPWRGGDIAEKIPFVFLPNKGQRVFPSSYLPLPLDSLISSTTVMTTSGWK